MGIVPVALRVRAIAYPPAILAIPLEVVPCARVRKAADLEVIAGDPAKLDDCGGFYYTNHWWLYSFRFGFNGQARILRIRAWLLFGQLRYTGIDDCLQIIRLVIVRELLRGHGFHILVGRDTSSK